MSYKFTFANIGGTSRVCIHSGEDIRHLGELDRKMFTVLSCPVNGLEIPSDSLSLIDSDNDGYLHIHEVVHTADWLCSVLKTPDTLFAGSDTVAIDQLTDNDLIAVAKEVAGDAAEVSLAQVTAAIDSVTVAGETVPEQPFADDVIAAYKAKEAEYKDYFHKLKLQKLGLEHIAEDVLVPGMTEEDFIEMGDKIAAWESAVQAAKDAETAALTTAREHFMPLRKLLLLHRDFVALLHNYVSFEDFYTDKPAVFQAGTLVIDQRACHLCIRVSDMSKHNTQAAACGMFLVYCDCVNKAGAKMQIAAAVTIGEIRNLSVGKNAVFYDRTGLDWNATVTKVIDNPISIGQAFWSPYRKFGNWVTDLVNKSAAEKDSKAFENMTANVEGKLADPNAAPADDKKSSFDIAKFAGIFAAIGMALGYIGAFLTVVAKSVHALAWWQLLCAIASIILVISGPAMVLAWMKLRRRNLAPLLNANGWAINADALISVLFGKKLTEKAIFPFIQIKKKKMAGWKIALIVLASVIVIVAIVLLVMIGLAPDNCACPIHLFNK